MYWLRTRTPGDMRSLLPCSKVTLLHRPRMPNTGAANALPECMGGLRSAAGRARFPGNEEAERRPKRKANDQ